MGVFGAGGEDRPQLSGRRRSPRLGHRLAIPPGDGIRLRRSILCQSQIVGFGIKNTQLFGYFWCGRRGSNSHSRFRRPVHYPLCYARLVGRVDHRTILDAGQRIWHTSGAKRTRSARVGSSAVEQGTLNPLAVGSIPTRRTKKPFKIRPGVVAGLSLTLVVPSRYASVSARPSPSRDKF